MDPRDKSVETEEKEGCETERAVLGRSKLPPQGEDDAPGKQEDEDYYVDTLGHSVAVESVIVGGDAGPCDENGDPRVVEPNEETIDTVRVVAEEVEESGAGETDHGGEEEAEEHGLIGGRELVDLNVFKQKRDVVAVDIDPQTEGDKEGKPQEVGPDVPCLRVHAEHALEAAEKRVHRWAMLRRQVLIVL